MCPWIHIYIYTPRSTTRGHIFGWMYTFEMVWMLRECKPWIHLFLKEKTACNPKALCWIFIGSGNMFTLRDAVPKRGGRALGRIQYIGYKMIKATSCNPSCLVFLHFDLHINSNPCILKQQKPKKNKKNPKLAHLEKHIHHPLKCYKGQQCIKMCPSPTHFLPHLWGNYVW